jgi:hypothetical protein
VSHWCSTRVNIFKFSFLLLHFFKIKP